MLIWVVQVYTLEVAVKEAKRTGGDSYSFIIDCTGIGYRVS